MPLELKTVLDKIGLENASTEEEFLEQFNGKFVTKENALQDEEIRSKFTGKFAGSVSSIAKREFGLEPSEIKDMKWEEVLKLGASKMKAKVLELEELGGKNSDEKFTELQEKLKKSEKSINDYKENLEKSSSIFAQKEAELLNKFKDQRVNYLITDAKNKISSKLKSGMSEAERFYLDHKIKDSILVDFDENDSAIVLDRQGKRITNPSKVGSFMSIEEIIEDIATKENLIIKNNTAQTSATTLKTNTTAQPQTVGNKAIDPAVLAKRRAFGL